MGQSININLEWDLNGRIQHTIPNQILGENVVNSVLSPSAAMFLCHQLGVLRPSYGLILISKILQILKSNNFILSPINSALKKATLEISPKGLRYNPKHPIFSNNDSLEEGSTQLVSNYIHYVHNKLSDLGKTPYKTLILVVLIQYFEFLSGEISEGRVSAKNDKWNINFTKLSTMINQSIMRTYTPIDESNYDPTNPEKEIIEWINTLVENNTKNITAAEHEHNELCKTIGIT